MVKVFRAGERHAPQKNGETWTAADRSKWTVLKILRWEAHRYLAGTFVAVFVAQRAGGVA